MQRRTTGRGLAAVLFTDIVGSTAIAAEMGNTRWSELVARYHRIVRRTLGRFGGHEVDTAGDGFYATFERPADAIRCAVAATEADGPDRQEHRARRGMGWSGGATTCGSSTDNSASSPVWTSRLGRSVDPSVSATIHPASRSARMPSGSATSVAPCTGVDISTLEVERIPVGFEVLGVDVDVASGEVWLYLGAAVAPP